MATKSTIRAVVVISLVCLFLSGNGCKEVINYTDTMPQLEVSVLGMSQTPVSGAQVRLFLNENDWSKKTNSVTVSSSDSNGKVLFQGLEEKSYYILAEKANLSNVLGVSYFSTPLKKNEIRVIQVKLN